MSYLLTYASLTQLTRLLLSLRHLLSIFVPSPPSNQLPLELLEQVYVTTQLALNQILEKRLLLLGLFLTLFRADLFYNVDRMGQIVQWSRMEDRGETERLVMGW